MKRLNFWRRDLGVQLLALYLLFVLPVVVAALIFDAAASAQLERDVKAADLALGRAIALETDAFLQQAMSAVSEFAAMPEVRSADSDQLAPLFVTAMAARPDINLFYFLDDKGTMVYHAPTGPGSTVGQDFSFRQYFKDARVTDGPVVSTGRISPTTGQPVTTVVHRVLNERGQFAGVVATNLALERLSETLAEVAAQDGSAGSDPIISIIDAGGQVIAHPDPQQLLSDAYTGLPGLKTLRGALPASQIAADSSGREWLYSYVPISGADWIVAVQRPTEVAFASPRAFHNGLLLAMGVFVVGGLFFWMMLSRRVIGPLEQLAEFSRTVGRRDDRPRSAYRGPDLTHTLARADQMGHLTRALKRMEESIERRFTELATLLETSRATSSSLDADEVIDTILEQVQRLMEVNTCALAALDEREKVLRIRASRGLSEEYARDLRIDPHDPRSPSMRAIASGRPVQVSDIETDASFEPFRDRARREGYRSLLAVPLHAPHIGPAALLVYRRDPHVFSHDEVELIWNFANHAAIALENAVLYSRTDEQLQEQTRVLESVMQSMNDGLILHDPGGRILFFNRRFAEAMDATPADLEGRPLDQIRREMLARVIDPAAFEAALSAALEGRGPRSFEFSVLRSGRRRDLRAHVFDVIDEDGNPIGHGELFQDITRYREVDRMKSALISTASHELRTPLASIKGYASTLLQDDVEWDAVSVRQFVQVISDEADRLTQLVDDLLDVSRIEAGTLRLHWTEQRLPDVIARALAQVKDPAGHTVTTDVPLDLPPLRLDARRIEVVVRNLVENAVKYSPPGSAARIQAERRDGHVQVTVTDEGPGVAPEHRDRIFDRFYRADDGYTRASGGAGLGLAICKGFVEAHGGSIRLEDSERGASFTFTLPMAGGDGEA